MVPDYKYEFRNGALTKVDNYGNLVEAGHDPDPISTKFRAPETVESILTGVSAYLSVQMDGALSHPVQASSEREFLKRTSFGVNDLAPELCQDSNSWGEETKKPISPIPKLSEQNSQVEPQTLGKQPLTRAELAKRDREAVAYSKALLTEGDTLVFITYPNEGKCFDSTGFELSAAPHRVHSGRLFATGSTVFAKLLSPTNQYRTSRRKKLVGRLPAGVHYVLDLTPPDEGDSAVELISELSCSLGIRYWYRSEQRCDVPNYLVGGEDEVLASENATSHGLLAENGSDSTPDPNSASTAENIAWQDYGSGNLKKDTDEAIQLSRVMKENRAVKELEVPEYCPVRHRAGIARLLQVLEGKDPRLDSAPKVWTLFVLAKFFDCTSTVVDWIVTWMLGGANARFIEILPEASCKMAFGLKNQLLCRAAFSILVSEEAMSLASRGIHKNIADNAKTNQFGRIREDIDEDLRTRIEYASKNFHSRVIQTFDDIINPPMSWLTTLGEYQKLKKFKTEIMLSLSCDGRSKIWNESIDELLKSLESLIRGRLLNALTSDISHDDGVITNQHRVAEQYTSKSPKPNFQNQYGNLGRDERLFTTHFWRKMIALELPTSHNYIHKASGSWAASFRPTNDCDVSRYSALYDLQKKVNEAMIEAIKVDCFNNGIMPKEACSYSMDEELQESGADLTKDMFGDRGKENKKYRRLDSKAFPHQGPDILVTQTTEVSVAMNPAENSTISPASKAKFTFLSWNPFGVSPSPPATAKTQWSRGEVYDKNQLIRDLLNDMELLSPTGLATKGSGMADVEPQTNGISCDSMDYDEYMAKNHLLDPAAGLNLTLANMGIRSNDQTPLLGQTDLPLRPRTIPSTQNDESQTSFHLINGKTLPLSNHIGHDAGLSAQSRPQYNWPDETVGTYKAETSDEIGHNSKAETTNVPHLENISQRSYKRKSMESHSIRNAPPTVPYDFDISDHSPFFSLAKFFQDVKDHIRKQANVMLDTRDMGFDVSITDTILSLGQEEFKYLPLWAGGDDDDSGGVFDDTIPVALAGPNGPGPSFHTGFSSASQASSEFDRMSDRTSFDTSIAVEDGFSDHIDRRLMVADDDFHSETFSEDSEVYDRKGKGVDRSGLFTSAPSSEAAFSTVDSTVDSSSERGFDAIASKTIDIEYTVEEDDEDDADTAVGQADDIGGCDDWDTGDDEAFDFGDGDSDEEMVEVFNV